MKPLIVSIAIILGSPLSQALVSDIQCSTVQPNEKGCKALTLRCLGGEVLQVNEVTVKRFIRGASSSSARELCLRDSAIIKKSLAIVNNQSPKKCVSFTETCRAAWCTGGYKIMIEGERFKHFNYRDASAACEGAITQGIYLNSLKDLTSSNN